MIHSFWTEFREFLKEFKVISVAIGFVMGQAVNELLKSFFKNIFMPLLNPIIPGGAWEEATWHIGSISLEWGTFVSSLLNFTILAVIIFLVVKKIMKHEIKN